MTGRGWEVGMQLVPLGQSLRSGAFLESQEMFLIIFLETFRKDVFRESRGKISCTSPEGSPTQNTMNKRPKPY